MVLVVMHFQSNVPGIPGNRLQVFIMEMLKNIQFSNNAGMHIILFPHV